MLLFAGAREEKGRPTSLIMTAPYKVVLPPTMYGVPDAALIWMVWH
jgi:hypothetical protein